MVLYLHNVSNGAVSMRPLGQKPRGRNKFTLLDRYKDEILDMRGTGYSFPQIALWLKEKNISVTANTVSRFVRAKME